MRFDNCPTCGGKLVVSVVKDRSETSRMFCCEKNHTATTEPCTRCDPGDGVPAGRICVMSAGELDAITDLCIGDEKELEKPGLLIYVGVQEEVAHRNFLSRRADTHRKEGSGE